ncbi:MAG TPA: ATP-dependent RNA helicase HrpA [Polyangiaceae bacterium]
MHPRLAALAADIDCCLIRDRHRLRSRLRKSAPAMLDAIAAEVERSKSKRERRAQNVPRPTYPPELPITKRKDEIAAAIREHQVVVVCGETGSGKSTQLPKICLELGRGIDGMIGHTQPRRLAARTLSARIASELNVAGGRAVGHKIRFSDRTGDDTYVKLMTDGILLAETQSDAFLAQYDTIIIDEAHERNLNIDFLLGYLKRLLPRRPELKLVITSATIDPERFARHFGGAPVLEVSGRGYPVSVRYRPLGGDRQEEEGTDEHDPELAVVDAIVELDQLEGARGDVLVFLPGEQAIRETADVLRKRELPQTEVLPLYARLSAGEQERIFRPHRNRRIVLSTNVAETSLTVPGVRYVVDTGLARISRYDVRRRVQRLPIERISQASANQRAGRCGRTSAGVCIRLYSEEDFLGRSVFTPPEIRRTNLAGVILQMESLGLGTVEEFPFLDPPETRAVRDGYATLFELGAIDEEHRLTRLGRELSRLPVDPRVGRMLLAGRDLRCLAEMLVIGAALSVQDPRVRPHDQQENADRAHARYRDQTSDFMSFLNVWRAFQEEALRLSTSKLRKWCEEAFLSYLRMREWQDVHDQLHRLMAAMGMRPNETAARAGDVHKALLSGLLGGVARKADDRTYIGARNVKMSLFPGSGLVHKRPEWIMAGEIVETDRLYARTAAKIDPAWIEPWADHLVGRSYSEPHWDKKRGQVIGYERVSLYGLTIVFKRKIDFARIDAEAAREIFLRTALVEGELRTAAPFLRHNLALVQQVEALQERSRRRDLSVDEQAIYAFYDRLVPSDVHTAARFEKWRKHAEAKDPRTLYLCRADILVSYPSDITEETFPTVMEVGGVRLPLHYRFDPGHAEDGVTVTVPLGALQQLGPGSFDWLVPGFLLEKITSLFESLPKALRKQLVPVRETAERCMKALSPSETPLTQALAVELERTTGLIVPPSAFRTDALLAHLSMFFRVVDESGKTVGTSRDFDALLETLSLRAKEAFERLPTSGMERERLTSWSFGDLPRSILLAHGELTVPGYPALVRENGGVALRVFPTHAAAEQAHRPGLRALYAVRLADVVKHVRRHLPGMQGLSFSFALLGTGDELKDDLMTAAIDRACIADAPLVRTAREFEMFADKGRGELAGVAGELCDRIAPVLAAYQDVMRALPLVTSAHQVADIRAHVATLVYPGFITNTPWSRLPHLPRYIKAIQLRIERMRQAPQKDHERAALLAPLVRQYEQRAADLAKQGLRDSELERYRWLLEEWRVSLYAQELKTAEPISEKRLADQWRRVAP